MKKLLIILLPLSILTACKREFDCECRVDYTCGSTMITPDTSGYYFEHMKVIQRSKNKANKECSSYTRVEQHCALLGGAGSYTKTCEIE